MGEESKEKGEVKKNCFGVTVRGESGVAGEGRVVCAPKFHSWGKCTMPLTNINSYWMSNASSGLYINLYYIILYYAVCCIVFFQS